MKKSIVVLKGDGIGPEVVEQALKVLDAVAKKFGHIFEYKEGGYIKDFPGNYTQLREKQMITGKQPGAYKPSKNKVSEISSEISGRKDKKQPLTFKEKREFEILSIEIENLESEKNLIEAEMNMGSLNPEVLYSKSKRHGEIMKLLDDKEMRWLELSER